jgi:hypothetical protein
MTHVRYDNNLLAPDPSIGARISNYERKREELTMKALQRSAAALALGMSVLSIPSLAKAQTNVVVGDTASLIARGVGAIVSVEITCAGPTTNWDTYVTLVQRVGNITTSGFGYLSGYTTNITCTSTPQLLEVAVTTYGRVFRRGSALAQANLFECDPDFSTCRNDQDIREIELLVRP